MKPANNGVTRRWIEPTAMSSTPAMRQMSPAISMRPAIGQAYARRRAFARSGAGGSARAWAVIGPPTILNHVVVGILLLPVGAAAIAAGRALQERWAWRLTWIIALASAALPAALVALMIGPDYNAVAFRIAEILVTLVGLAMPAALLRAWRRAPWAGPRQSDLADPLHA
jgi:hypothetical protein